MRVDHNDALAGQNVSHGEVEKNRRFPAAALAKEHQVLLALVVRQEYIAVRRCCYGWYPLHKPEEASGAKHQISMLAERFCGREIVLIRRAACGGAYADLVLGSWPRSTQ